MKLVATVLLFLGLAFTSQAQEVSFNGAMYKIKGKAILQEGADVTSSLSVEDQAGIWDAFNKQKALEKEREEAEKVLKEAEKKQKEAEKAQKAAEKEQKKAEKEQKKAEKEQKKAEKAQKKAEKELKAKEKAQSKFDDANEDYTDALSKYEKLKVKGKLSPNDETKWQGKLLKLKDNINKAKKKL